MVDTSQNSKININTHNELPIIGSMGMGAPASDRRRILPLERMITIDNDSNPYLTVTFYKEDDNKEFTEAGSDELGEALGIGVDKIQEKYMQGLARRIEVAYDAKATITRDAEGNFGVTVPIKDCNLSVYRNALLVEGKRLSSLLKDNEEIQKVDKEARKEELFEAVMFAKYDLARTMKSNDLNDLVQRSITVLIDTEELQKGQYYTEKQVIKALSSDPEISKKILEGILPEGIQAPEGGLQFTLAGTGRSGVFLKTEIPELGEVVVGLRVGNARRLPVPTQLQSFKKFQVGDLEVELTPSLDTVATLPHHLKEIDKATASYADSNGNRYYDDDPAVRNIGLAKTGLALHLDGDGIAVAKDPSSEIDGELLRKWVREDGTWEQYHIYREMHEAYNSPLHQQRGKIAPLEIKPIVNKKEELVEDIKDVEHNPPISEVVSGENVDNVDIATIGEVEQAAESTAATVDEKLSTSENNKVSSDHEPTVTEHENEPSDISAKEGVSDNSPPPSESNHKENKAFPVKEAAIALGAVGAAYFIGNDKTPQNTADEKNSEKQQNWFRRNVKLFAKTVLFAVALDMGQAAFRGEQSYTEKAAKATFGFFTNMVNKERQGNTQTRKLF